VAKTTLDPARHDPGTCLPPAEGDPGVWHVRVKVHIFQCPSLFWAVHSCHQEGYERDIVMAIFERASVTRVGVLAVFSRDFVKGFIYMEAHSLADVHETLLDLKGIKYSPQKTLQVDFVPIVDRIALLEMNSPPITIARGSWV
jgi:hypothetical protein